MIPTDMARDPTDSSAPVRARDRPARDRWLVIYDRDCGFCRWSLARLLALDRAGVLRPVALGTAEADAALADLPVPEREASWHLVAPDGRRASAGGAAAPLLSLLPGGRAPAWLLRRMPGLTERAYRWVANHRSWFSRAIPARAKKRADALITRRARAR